MALTGLTQKQHSQWPGSGLGMGLPSAFEEEQKCSPPLESLQQNCQRRVGWGAYYLPCILETLGHPYKQKAAKGISDNVASHQHASCHGGAKWIAVLNWF